MVWWYKELTFDQDEGIGFRWEERMEYMDTWRRVDVGYEYGGGLLTAEFS